MTDDRLYLMSEGAHKVMREICNVALQWYRNHGTAPFKVLVNPNDGFEPGEYNFGLGFTTLVMCSKSVDPGEIYFQVKKRNAIKSKALGGENAG